VNKKIETSGGAYGWTDENIKISEKALSHIAHHVNNPLCVLVARISRMPDSAEKEILNKKVTEISLYMKWLQTNI